MPSETITVSADNSAGALQALGNAEKYGSFRLKGLTEASVSVKAASDHDNMADTVSHAMSSFADARMQDRKAISSAVTALGNADRVAAYHILSGE
ncbi:MAG: hypothetical protein ACFNZQ_00510 [Scardovia wiggsiae]|uniref:hypothetical protein n=1 Tax=Scardovia wiggsiae TaxID=230143 RepID=UPI003612FD80